MGDLTPTHLTRYLKLLMPKEGLTDAVRRAIDQMELERSPVAPDAPFATISGQTVPPQSAPKEVGS
jgi:hypothetical protein